MSYLCITCCHCCYGRFLCSEDLLSRKVFRGDEMKIFAVSPSVLRRLAVFRFPFSIYPATKAPRIKWPFDHQKKHTLRRGYVSSQEVFFMIIFEEGFISNGFQWTDWTLKNSKIETSHHFQDVTVTPVDLTKEGPIQNSRAVPTQTGATVVPIHVWKFGQLDRPFFQELFDPKDHWDLKTGGLEIPNPCYTHPNPSIAGSSDS